MPAEWTTIGGSLAGHARQDGGIERVALCAVAPLAGALVFALNGRGFPHGGAIFRPAGVGSQRRGGNSENRRRFSAVC
jgi:hypothetical protein